MRTLLFTSLAIFLLTGCSNLNNDSITVTGQACISSRYNAPEGTKYVGDPCAKGKKVVQCKDDPEWCDQVRRLQVSKEELLHRRSFSWGECYRSAGLEGKVAGVEVVLYTECDEDVVRPRILGLAYAKLDLEVPSPVPIEPDPLIDCERLSPERQEQLRCPSE